MSRHDGIDPTLRSWFEGDAAGTAPAHLFDAVVDQTRHRRQHPAWLGSVLGHGTGRAARIVADQGRDLVAFAIIAGLVLAVVGGALLSTGSSPTATTVLPVAPASITVPAPTCPEVGLPAPAPGVLPEVGRPPIERPRNGLLASWDPSSGALGLYDPTSWQRLATWARVSATNDAWSPDGRWLAVHSLAVQPMDGSTGCWDIVIISSDGTRVVRITENARGDEAFASSWSPDGRWMAVASNHLEGPEADWAGAAIDVVGIGEDGDVAERRRVWTHEVGPVGSVAWGPDGTLAWLRQREAGGHDLHLLRPGAAEATTIGVDDGVFPIRWTPDATAIVAVGNGGLHVISVAVAVDHLVPLPITPRHGIDVSDDPVAVSSSGHVYLPGREPDRAPYLYRVDLDGGGLLNMSSGQPEPNTAAGPVLSPDESSVVFRGGDDGAGGVWVVGHDGLGLQPLPIDWGLLSWQPIP